MHQVQSKQARTAAGITHSRTKSGEANDTSLSLSCVYTHSDSLHIFVSSSHALLCFPYSHAASALVCPFLSVMSLAWWDPGFCISRPTWVLVCYYNNTWGISCALSSSLESVPSLFLCDNRKMWPSPRV